MRDTRLGKTDNLKAPIVIYYLSDTKDVFRVVNEISKALGAVSIGELPYVYRYSKGNDDSGEVMVVCSIGKKEACERKPKNEDVLSAGDFDDNVKELLNGVDFFEMPNGFYAVKVDIENNQEVTDLCEKLLNTSADLWLQMGNSAERVAFKPDYIDGQYVLAQYVIPCLSKDNDEIKSVKGIQIPVC